MLLFATRAYKDLAESLAGHHRLERGEVERKVFGDGELYQRFVSDVRDRDVMVLGGTCDEYNALEVFDLACGVVHQGARTLRLVLPYFGWSTQERASQPGEIVTAKTRAIMLSAIPRAREGNQIVLLDLHTPGIEHYFEGSLRTLHLTAKALVTERIRCLSGAVVLACTDAGRAKWVESLANEAGVEAAFVYKRRGASGDPAITGVNADVRGKHVVIYDDMIRSGGSLVAACEAYAGAGASEISAIATHGVFPGDSLTKLLNRGVLTSLAVTDSHPQARRGAREHPELIVLPIRGLIWDFVDRCLA